MLRELESIANSKAAETNVAAFRAEDDDFHYSPRLPKPSLDEICRLYCEWSLRNEWEFRQETSKRYREDTEALLRGELLPLPPQQDIADLSTYEVLVAAYRYRIERTLRRSKLAAVAQDIQDHAWFIAHLSEDMDYVPIEPEPHILAALARTDILVLEQMLKDDSAVLGHVSTDHQLKASANLSSTLSQVASEYFRGNAGLSPSYADAIKASVRDLIEVTGDKAVSSYGKRDAAAFKEVLLMLPANWRKKKTFRDLGIVEASRKASKLGLQRQRAKTIKVKWFHITTIFAYAQHNYDGVTNTFHAKSLIVSDNVAANDQWLPFSNDELATLLKSPLPGRLFWLTWLGLFTGARLNELCQLDSKHIKRHGNLHYIHFSRDMQLKTGDTESCVRTVPLHSTLIRLGFLDYIAQCRGLLFPGLVEDEKTGRLSGVPSKRFSYHLTKIGVKKPRLSFHSLRHTFIACLKTVAPRDAETRERLVGHAVSGVAGRYGKGYEAEAADMELLVERAKVVELVRFEAAVGVAQPALESAVTN